MGWLGLLGTMRGKDKPEIDFIMRPESHQRRACFPALG
jgi:hypothetical protein